MSENVQHPGPTVGLSVVVPVYNSQESLAPLVQRLIPVLSELTATFEIILVNDEQPLSGEDHTTLCSHARAKGFSRIIILDSKNGTITRELIPCN